MKQTKDRKKISKQQKAFADAWIKNGGNVLQACKTAKYSDTYSNSQGYKLLENVGILEYIAKKTRNADVKNKMELDEAIQLITDLARGEVVVSKSKTINNLEKQVTSDKTYEHTADIEMRLRALEMIIKLNNGYKENNISNAPNINVSNDVIKRED